MKPHIGGYVVASYWDKVIVWGTANDLGNTNTNIPHKQFNKVCKGYSIEFLDEDRLLRGGIKSHLEFIDYEGKYKYGDYKYGKYGKYKPLLPTIRKLHICSICAIQRIAKNMVVIASDDGYLKVVDPIRRRCYLKFKVSGVLLTLAYIY